jgi:dihydroorotate dehydrogenase electron transfer subunit
MLQVKAPVTRIEKLHGHVRITFDHPQLAEQCSPGQFLTFRTSPQPVPLLRRPFSIHDVVGSEISILAKILGPGTMQLSRVREGDLLDVLGPLGHGFDIPQSESTVLLIGGGIGIAPLLFSARRLKDAGMNDVRLYFGGATRADLVALELLEPLVQMTTVTTEDGSAGGKGFVTGSLEKDLAELGSAQCEIWSCGPWPMLRAVSEIAAAANVPCQVSLETVMACGVGSCMGCITEAIDCTGEHEDDRVCYERVCNEGPVFDSTRIKWKAK